MSGHKTGGHGAVVGLIKRACCLVMILAVGGAVAFFGIVL